MVFLIFPWLAMLAAFMSTFLAVRHTRMDEEQGRAELVSATPAGRTTPVVATAIHGLIANFVLAALTTLAFLGTRMRASTGAKVAGFAVGAVGVAFLGIGLVAGQLMRTSRGANSLAVWILVATFLFCGIGNALGTPSDDLQRMESSWLDVALAVRLGRERPRLRRRQPVAGVLALVFGLVLAGVAIALQSARDLGESFIPERLGRAEARTPALDADRTRVAPDLGRDPRLDHRRAAHRDAVDLARLGRRPGQRRQPRDRETSWSRSAAATAASSRRPSRSSS